MASPLDLVLGEHWKLALAWRTWDGCLSFIQERVPRRSIWGPVPTAGTPFSPFLQESKSDGEERDTDAWLAPRGHQGRRALGTPRGSFMARVGRGLVVTANLGPVFIGGESWEI